MMYLITIHGILSMIVLYIVLQYTDYNEELYYKEVEVVEMKKEARALIRNITLSFGEICEQWEQTTSISPESCNLSGTCLVYKNMNLFEMKYNQDQTLKQILDFYNRHFNSHETCFKYVKDMMELMWQEHTRTHTFSPNV